MSPKDVDPEELRKLADVFRNAGADDPESWAHSQLAEDIPQLAIFSFAKALWQCVVAEDNDRWIEGESEWAEERPNDPCAQIGSALQEMIDKGVTRSRDLLFRFSDAANRPFTKATRRKIQS